MKNRKILKLAFSLLLFCINTICIAQKTIVNIEHLTKPQNLLPLKAGTEVYKQFKMELEKSSNLPDKYGCT